MENRIKISILMDYYRELLTKKQKDVMELYFNEDLSLAEISELTKTSRQAIYDIIKRCNKLLFNYESKLKLAYKDKQIKKNKQMIIKKIDIIKQKTSNTEFINSLEEIKSNIVEFI